MNIDVHELLISGHSVIRCIAMESEDNSGTNLQKQDPGNMLTVPEDIAARVREERRILALVLAEELENPESPEGLMNPEVMLLLVALMLVAVPVVGFLVFKKMTQDYALFVIPTVICSAGFAVAFWAQERLRVKRARAAKALHRLAEELDKHDDD